MKRLDSDTNSNFRSMPLRALTGKMYSSTRQMTNITSQGIIVICLPSLLLSQEVCAIKSQDG